MRILLIGATGTIGSKVRERLEVEHEVLVVGYTRGDYQVDIADKASILSLYQQVGEVDAVISAAGNSSPGAFDEMTDEQYALGWNNKLMGQINVARVGLPYIHEGGVIILTSGVLADEPLPGFAGISAVNGGLNSFTKAAALDIGNNLRINIVSPPFSTETLEMIGMDSTNSLSATDIAKAYEAALVGRMNGEVLDARDYI